MCLPFNNLSILWKLFVYFCGRSLLGTKTRLRQEVGQSLYGIFKNFVGLLVSLEHILTV